MNSHESLILRLLLSSKLWRPTKVIPTHCLRLCWPDAELQIVSEIDIIETGWFESQICVFFSLFPSLLFCVFAERVPLANLHIIHFACVGSVIVFETVDLLVCDPC